MAQNNLGPKKNSGPKKKSGPKKNWAPKKIRAPQKKTGPNNLRAQKCKGQWPICDFRANGPYVILGSKTFLGPKKNSGPYKISGPKKKSGPKKIWAPQKTGPKNLRAQKCKGQWPICDLRPKNHEQPKGGTSKVPS